MHINFRAQPDPLLKPRGSIKPGPHEEKATFIPFRNNPHPQTVNQIKGLNNVPLCVVRDPNDISGHFIMPKIEQDQSTMHTRTSIGHTFPGTSTTPHLQSLRSKRNSFPQSISCGPKEDIALLANRTKNALVLKRRSDVQRKYIPEQSLNMSVPDARALPPTLALRHRPEIMEDMNYNLTYLDHEIKILEKLHDILQTDSLTEIKEWLSKASLKEKELVSDFIRSDITTQDLLNYKQKYRLSGSEATQLNLQGILKGQKVTGSPGEEKQRNVTQGPRGSIVTKPDRERDDLFTKGEKIIIPTCDLVPLEHSLSRSKMQERRLTPTGMPPDSSHLIYRKSRSLQPQHTTEENVPPKRLSK